jgi:hypothetical protein
MLPSGRVKGCSSKRRNCASRSEASATVRGARRSELQVLLVSTTMVRLTTTRGIPSRMSAGLSRTPETRCDSTSLHLQGIFMMRPHRSLTLNGFRNWLEMRKRYTQAQVV